jgi:hypothetical protein
MPSGPPHWQIALLVYLGVQPDRLHCDLWLADLESALSSTHAQFWMQRPAS